MKGYRVLLLTSFFVFLSYILSAQVIETGNKLNSSVDYQRLKRIDSLVNSYIQNDWVEGVVTLIVKNNQLIQYKGYGYADSWCQVGRNGDVKIEFGKIRR